MSGDIPGNERSQLLESGREKPRSARSALLLGPLLAVTALFIAAASIRCVLRRRFLVGDGFSSIQAEAGESAFSVVQAQRSPGMTSMVLECHDLLYSQGANATTDSPDHVRAASSLQFVSPNRLAVMQDDLNFIALVDIEYDDTLAPRLQIQRVSSIALPAHNGDERQFQTSRHNKGSKFDLESSVVLQDGTLIGFGSGSSSQGHRDVLAVIRASRLKAETVTSTAPVQTINVTFWNDYRNSTSSSGPHPSDVMLFYALHWYQSLRANTAFSGSELNLEGATLVNDATTIRLLQRGNGKAKNGLSPKSATGDVLVSEVSCMKMSVLARFLSRQLCV